ncbi:hypothetical protein MK489_20240 [Myxococcota bacterium]|nr:hypothetical protein [Myxococcota bacterium]
MSQSQPEQLHRSLWLSLYAAAALAFTAFYRSSTVEYTWANLESLTDFSAHTPYQYRILVPALARIAHEWLGISPPAFIWSMTAATALGLLIAFRAYLATFMPSQAASFAASWILYPLLWNQSPMSTWRFFYPSDLPAVLLFTLGLLTLARERHRAFLGIFALACLNRETSALLSVAFLATGWGHRPSRELLRGLLLQIVIWGAIKLALGAAFAHNDGTPYDFMGTRNLALFAGLLQGHPPLGVLTACGLIWLPIPWTWRFQPDFLRRVMWVGLPFLGGMALVGNLDELRIYGELAPVLTAPAVYGVWARFTSSEVRPENGKPPPLSPD